MLPVAAVVIGVRQYGPNEDLVPVVVDYSDQSILVATDVEHRQAVHVIGTGERRSQVVEVGKNFAFHRAIPRLQRTFGVWVLYPELNKCRLGNDVHVQSIYQNGIKLIHAYRCLALFQRLSKGISQEKLALLAEVDRSYAGRVERGDNNVAVLTLARLAGALDISLAKLMQEADL